MALGWERSALLPLENWGRGNVANASVEVTAFAPPPCVLIKRITPGQLVVGRKTVVKIYLSRQGRPVAGIRVQIKGAGINITTKARTATASSSAPQLASPSFGGAWHTPRP